MAATAKKSAKKAAQESRPRKPPKKAAAATPPPPTVAGLNCYVAAAAFAVAATVYGFTLVIPSSTSTSLRRRLAATLGRLSILL
eukprot:SAG11_NODE_994_length_6261_cov_10.558747_10_plen_84_part_00